VEGALGALGVAYRGGGPMTVREWFRLARRDQWENHHDTFKRICAVVRVDHKHVDGPFVIDMRTDYPVWLRDVYDRQQAHRQSVAEIRRLMQDRLEQMLQETLETNQGAQ
jgi:hypothetical protein